MWKKIGAYVRTKLRLIENDKLPRAIILELLVPLFKTCEFWQCMTQSPTKNNYIYI